MVHSRLQADGWSCSTEAIVPERGDGHGGRLDLVATKPEVAMAIEIDRGSPREKSVAKLLAWKSPIPGWASVRAILTRSGAEGPPPAGIDALVRLPVVEPTSPRREVNAAIERLVERGVALGQRFDRRARRALRERLLGGETEEAVGAAIEAEARQAEEREQRARPFPGFVERVQAKMRGELPGLGPELPPAPLGDAVLAELPDSGDPRELAEDAWEPVITETPAPVPAEVFAFLADFPGIDAASAAEMWPAWAVEHGLVAQDDVDEGLWALQREIAATSGPDP